MKGRNGLRLGIVGLVVGLTLGLGVVIFKRWLIQEIVSSLQEEAAKACKCSLTYDSIDISFLTLSGKARNVRLIHQNKPRLVFDQLAARFSIEKLLKKTVILSELNIRDGWSDGVGPGSPTFKFIDQLTTAPPPEKARPNRWRVVLDRLRFDDVHFFERWTSSELRGDGMRLQVTRVGEDFVLEPEISRLALRLYDSSSSGRYRELVLGTARSTLIIQDRQIRFNSLRLGDGKSKLDARFDAHLDEDDRLTGKFTAVDSVDYFGVPEWLQGGLSSEGIVRGSLGSPILDGNVTGGNLSLRVAGNTLLHLPDVRGTMVADLRRGDPIVTAKLACTTDTVTFGTQSALTIDDERVEGSFTIATKTFDLAPLQLNDVEATVSVSGSLEKALIRVRGIQKDLRVVPLSFGGGNLDLTFDGDRLTASATPDGGADSVSSAEIEMEFPDSEPPRIVESSFRIEGRDLGSLFGQQPLGLPVNAQGSVRGPLSLPSLIMESDITIAPWTFDESHHLVGTGRLDNGKVSLLLDSPASDLSLRFVTDLTADTLGELRVSARGMPLAAIDGRIGCGTIAGSVDYRFPLREFSKGDGTMQLSSLVLGCDPYTVTLAPELDLPLKTGELSLAGATITGVNSSLQLGGSISLEKGYNATIEGTLFMNSFIPFVKGLENFQGRLTTSAAVSGPLGAPIVRGKATLTDGEVALSDVEVVAQDVRGEVVLSEEGLEVRELSGTVNDGTVSIRGKTRGLDLAFIDLTLDFNAIQFEPTTESTVTASGSLRLAPGAENRPSFKGEIVIDHAEFVKDFEPNRLLLDSVLGFFRASQATADADSSTLPEIELDVTARAQRNIFVNTTYITAEFSGLVRARGTVQQPQLEGGLRVLNGWLGLRDNRFEIVSGTVEFRPGSTLPVVDMSAEGPVRTGTGENVLMVVDVTGPVMAPKITLSSDREFAHDELLLLLTSNRNLTGRTLVNTYGTGEDADPGFLASESFSSFSSFFRNLTRIDALSFEPIYSSYTGAIEPAVVARKRLADRLSLIGENTFGAVTQSRVGLIYNWFPSVNVSAIADSISTRQNTALGVDVTYTIWAAQQSFLNVELLGNEGMERDELLRAARITDASRIPPGDLPALQRLLADTYLQQGFFDSEVKVTCEEDGAYCRDLRIEVTEGLPRNVAEIAYPKDSLTGLIPEAKLPDQDEDQRATDAYRRGIEREVTQALRAEGYLSARVTVRYDCPDARPDCTLVLEIDAKDPVSFVFRGNTIFSTEELLSGLDLFNRKRPFGNNTIRLLIASIENQYQAAGYLYTTVSYEEQTASGGRLTYIVTISEDVRTVVEQVRIEGNEILSTKALLKAIDDLGGKGGRSLLKPKPIVPDELSQNVELIRAAYAEEGFSDTSVEYVLKPNEDGSYTDVVYRLSEGTRFAIDRLEPVGLPDDFDAPPFPPGPLSVPRVNRYVDQLIRALRDDGYFYPGITLNPEPDGRRAQLVIELGPRTSIEAVRYEGLFNIAPRVITANTTLIANRPLRQEDIATTKRNLLKLGLFSRVDIVAEDGDLDAEREALIIRVSERALQTLEVGGGANSEFGAHIFGEATDKSLFRDGRSLSVRLDSYLDTVGTDSSGLEVSQGFASLRYFDPLVFDKTASLAEELRYQRQDLSTQEFDQDRLSLASYLYRQFTGGLTTSFGHTLLSENLENVSPDAVLSEFDTGTVRLGFLSGSLAFDRRNDALAPHKGFTFSAEPKVASPLLGSEAEFASISSRGTYIYPLSSLWSISAGVHGGTSWTLGDTEQIPITQRFYLGGRSSVRGFRENSLGPRGDQGAVLGGDRFLAGNLQVQYLIRDAVSLHTFLDIGNVYLRGRESFGSDLRESAGIGVRYLSPIGPIGLDFGHPLDEKPGEPSWRIHFSVGSLF